MNVTQVILSLSVVLNMHTPKDRHDFTYPPRMEFGTTYLAPRNEGGRPFPAVGSGASRRGGVVRLEDPTDFPNIALATGAIEGNGDEALEPGEIAEEVPHVEVRIWFDVNALHESGAILIHEDARSEEIEEAVKVAKLAGFETLSAEESGDLYDITDDGRMSIPLIRML